MTHFKRLVRITFGALFVAVGVLHFVRPAPFVAIVPPYLPWPTALVFVSGAAEIVFGALLLFRGTMALAAWGLILLLVAVYPANIHMAFHPDLYPSMSPAALWARLPLQFALIGIAFWLRR